MGLLKPRSSIPEKTFIGTTTILLILLLVAVVAFMITYLRHGHRRERINLPLTPRNTRGFSRNNLQVPQQQAWLQPPQYQQQQRRPSDTRPYTSPSHPSPYSAPHISATSAHTTHLPTFSPSSAPTQKTRPYSPPIPPSSLPKPNSPDTTARDALMARLAAMPLTSDTTDDTGFDAPGREIVNASFAERLARRRVQDGDPTAAMLIGSEEGTTDAGGVGEWGGGGGRYAALLARSDGDRGVLRERSGSEGAIPRGGGGFGYAGDGRAWGRGGGTSAFGWDGGSVMEEDEEPFTPRMPPLALRKVNSDPY